MINTYPGIELSEKKWLVLSVGFRKEKTVSSTLASKQIEAYVPLKDRSFRYASKSVVRQLPILPGYVFVHTSRKAVGQILDIPFVFHFLKTGTSYSEVTKTEIEHLRRISSTEHLVWFDQTEEDQLKEGALVEIVKGPLAGVRGRFVATKGRNVFLISFGDNLQTQLGTFEVKPEDIAPLVELATG